jgi:hypothetical protein
MDLVDVLAAAISRPDAVWDESWAKLKEAQRECAAPTTVPVYLGTGGVHVSPWRGSRD